MPVDPRDLLPDLDALRRTIQSEPLRRLQAHFDEMDADDADDSFFYDDDDFDDDAPDPFDDDDDDSESDDDLDDF